MGKKSGSSSSSWLTAVKRAFRSPNKKEHNNNAHGNAVDEDEDKVRLLCLVSRSCYLILSKDSCFFYSHALFLDFLFLFWF